MHEKPGEPMAYVLYPRRVRQAPRPGEGRHARRPCRRCRPTCRATASGFAKWLLRPEHPLTARVTVNRFWQEVFGTGLVRTSGRLRRRRASCRRIPSCSTGWPSSSARSGWDVKRFFKLLVTSATYRQAAVVTPEKLEKDRDNRLLSRGPRFRMDAEMVRDYALAASGLLVRKIGGPSVKPYQPDGRVGGGGDDRQQHARLPAATRATNLYRRSMYTFWKRAAPPASMDIFNAPSREACTVRRERTNTPLAGAGDAQRSAVRRGRPASWPSRRCKEAADDRTPRIDFIARRLLARPFSRRRRRWSRQSLADAAGLLPASTPDEAKKLIAVGESKADPTLDVADAGRLDDAGQRVDEPGRSVEQVAINVRPFSRAVAGLDEPDALRSGTTEQP